VIPRLRVALAALPVVLGCGRSPPPAPTVATPPEAVGGVASYFPLEEGRVYHYVTSEAGLTGMLVARVHRTDATHGELRLSNATKRFVYSPEAVAYDSGVFVLKGPLAVGTSWPGEHGGTTRIATVDAAPTVAAGTYASCVQTVEEGGRPPGGRYLNTYCPGIGLVLLQIQAAGGDARAELKSYGPPVTL
jgi:hypothetical protein